MIQGRFFLVGCPRSGTTLLQSMLGCSPELATFKESHFFSRAFPQRLKTFPAMRNPRRLVQEFYAENNIELNADISFSLVERLSRVSTGRFFIRSLDRAAEYRDCLSWLEKTPRHLLYIDLIESSETPETAPIQFIHLVRDGVAVASSLYRASESWSNPVSPINALLRWQKEINVTRRFVGRPNHHLVIYEDLVDDAERICLSLANVCGIYLKPEHLLKREMVLSNITRDNETWKMDTAHHQVKHLSRAESHVGKDVLEVLESKIDRTDYNWLRRFSCSERPNSTS